ncbi:MAG: BrnA antitoxin family protein [Devosia sp.]
MSDRTMRRASLDDIRKMEERGELFHDPDAPEGESLGAEFWAKAEIVEPHRPRSVHLKLDPDVFEFFYSESHGKGHLTRMQNVLRSYVNARRQS